MSNDHQQNQKGENWWNIFDRRNILGDWLFVLLCMLAIYVEPLFFLIPEINDDKTCLVLNPAFKITASVSRSIFDFFYMIYTLYKLWQDLDEKKKNDSLWYDLLKIENEPLWLLLIFLVDLMIVLPVPQVLVFYHPEDFVFSFYTLAILLALRIIRMYPLFRKTKCRGQTEEIIFALAIYFYTFGEASGVIGTIWYFLAVKRKRACWDKAFKEHGLLYSNKCLRNNYTFVNDFCSARKNSEYNFGIFSEALTSGIAQAGYSLKRSIYCWRWGLQSLSGFGNGLVTSTDKEENVFVLSITLFGVLLLIVSIGLVQNIIDDYVKRLRNERKITKKLDQWKPFGSLPVDLKKKIQKRLPEEMHKTTDVDLENILHHLSDELKKPMKCELIKGCLTKVEEFRSLRKDLLEELCSVCPIVTYTAGTHIIQMGDPVNEMIFVVDGELRTYTTNGTETTAASDHVLKYGDFCGKELLDWLQNFSTSNDLIPTSNRAIQAITKVEAFVLLAHDLRKVYDKQMNSYMEEQSAETQQNASDLRILDWFTTLKQFLFCQRERPTLAEEP